MNKVFKVVWSKARGCYVVASEFAKSHTKGGRSMKGMVVATAVALTLGVNGLALAVIPEGTGDGLAIGSNSEAKTADDTAVGKNATAKGEAYNEEYDDGTIIKRNEGNATAIGSQAKATMANSTAVGVKAQALTGASTAIGMGAKANAIYEYTTEDGVIHVGNATAVGVNAQALGADSTALGVGAQALAYNSTALGIGTIAASNNSTAVGNAKVGENATSGTALGNGASVSNGAVGGTALGTAALADKTSSTAVGVSSKAYGANSIALSNGAKAYGMSSTALGHLAVANALNSMAVGASAGANGDSSIAAGHSAKAYGYGSVGLGHLTIAGDSTITGTMYAIAVGDRAHATDLYSIALGFTSRATGDDSIAQGRRALALDDNTIAIGYNAQAGSGTVTWTDTYTSDINNASKTDARYATAIGYSSKAYSENSLALGHLAAVRESAKEATAVGYNASVSDKATGATVYGSTARGYDTYATAIGYGAEAGASGSVVKVNATAVGYKAKASGDSSIALGDQAKSYGESTIAIGTGAEAGRGGLRLGYYTAAIGYAAKAKAEDSLALGHSAEADENAVQALAMGSDAHVYGAKNVVLGAGSNDGSSTGVVVGGYGVGDTTYTGDEYVFTTSNGDPTSLKVKVSEFAGIGSGVVGTVSVGSDGQTRTLTNVAAGRISEDSTEAINGSQLYSVIDSLPEQFHTVNGNDKDSSKGEKADAPEIGKGYVGGNLLIKADQDEKTGDITYDISLNNELDLGKNGSIKFGDKTIIKDNSIQVWDTTINNDGLTINNGPSFTKTEIDVGGNVIHNAGTTVGGEQNKYDVVNVDYLQQYVGKNSHAHTVNGADNNGVGTAAGENYNTVGNLLIKAEKDSDGNILSYDISLNKELNLGGSGSIKFGDKTIIKDNSIQVGDTYIDNSSVKISGTTVNNKTYGDIVIKQGNVSYGDNIIKNVGTTTGSPGNEHDVVNVEYLQRYVSGAGNTDTHIQAGEYKVGEKIKDGVQMNIVDKDGKTTGTVTITDVAKASDVADIDNRVTKIEGDVTNIKGDITDIKTDISNIGDRVTTIEGDITDIRTDITNIEKVAGQHTEVTVEGNAPENGKGYVGGNLQLKVDKDTNGKAIYDIKLNKDIDLGTDGSLTVGKTTINENNITTNEIKVGGNTTITGDSVNVGDTHITNKQITVGDKVTINDNSVKVGDITINEGNIDMGGNKITNIADGSDPKDAVNVSQLEKVENKVLNNSVQINKLGSRIDKVGAGAAALAALHPLDFDPDDKFYLSAGYGNYRGENAVAVGAFYQPNDDTLFSISSTVGNDDDMINAGVTWRFGQSSHQSRSKKAMAKEIIELRTEVAELKAMVYSLTGYGMNMEKSKLFPDTPENHWAYDYVAVVAGNGILEGYPDGYFDGERPMTRYEMAAVVYRLLQKGVQVDNRMIQEFAPELARVRVDTLTHYNDGTPNIQRVRVIEGRG